MLIEDTGRAGLASVRQEIESLYTLEGAKPYGLHHINQVQHALQAATHAERRERAPAFVIACLLHDVGHMIHDLGETPVESLGVDDRHEELGAAWVAERFPAAVSEPIRLHVAAKRFLCATEPGYRDRLSKDSMLSLVVQGDSMSAEEQARFLSQAYAEEAIALRRIDEMSKDPKATTPTLATLLDRHLPAAILARP